LADFDKLTAALERLAIEDPTFRVKVDPETGQTIISGMGELYLDIIVDRLLREFKVSANVGEPQVAYRETIQNEATSEGKYAKQTGGKSQYGHVVLRLGPLSRGSGLVFEDKSGGVISKEFMPSVAQGVKEAMENGVLMGYPVIDVKATMVGGSESDTDSSELAFKVAASMAFKTAMREANPVLLEPVMDVEVVLPEEFVGAVTGDLNSRRGRIIGSGQRGQGQVIKAKVPLAKMFGYATELRSSTQGRATYTMQFSHYEPISKAARDALMSR
jgi:elongation factor G